MGKEEKIINGILHHRSSPYDEFKAYTAKELSQQVKYLRWEIEDIGAEFEILSNKLKSIKSIIDINNRMLNAR